MILAGNYSSIYQRDMFRLAPPPPPKVEIKPIIREPLLTDILYLKGTIVLEGTGSLAVIEDRQSKTETIYPEGGLISGARIIRIEQNRVTLLDKENKEIVLSLSSLPALSHSVDGIQSPRGSERMPPRAILYPGSEKKSPEEAKTVSLGEVNRVMTQNKEEISSLRVAPIVEAGKIAGYQVKNIATNSLAARYGIQNGDVVTKVNGMQLESLAQAGLIYRSLQPGSPVSVEILRQGKTVTLNLQIQP